MSSFILYFVLGRASGWEFLAFILSVVAAFFGGFALTGYGLEKDRPVLFLLGLPLLGWWVLVLMYSASVVIHLR
jgi:hypothetical protein